MPRPHSDSLRKAERPHSELGDAIAERLTVVPSKPIPTSLGKTRGTPTSIPLKASTKKHKRTAKKNKIGLKAVRRPSAPKPVPTTVTLTVTVGK